MTTGTLYWGTRRCSAPEALAALTGDVTVLAATPIDVTVAARRDGGLLAPGSSPWTVPTACFQLTAFDRERELRWLADGASGAAVWLAESADLLPEPPSGTLRYVERLPQRFVLWGLPEASAPPGVFSTWSQARVGRAHYPCPPGAEPGDRAVLDAVEYVTVDDHGNAAVADTRLTAISTMSGATR
ncbi:MAG: CRISPR-associated protein Csx19 [Pseudonocardiaceae bacterium]